MLVTGDMMGIKAQVVVTCTSKWERQLCFREEKVLVRKVRDLMNRAPGFL